MNTQWKLRHAHPACDGARVRRCGIEFLRFIECMIAQHLSVGKLRVVVSAALALCMGLSLAGCSKKVATDIRTEASLEELNVALDTWMMVKGTIPPTVSELTNFPALKTKRLPTASPGKKLAIDPATRRVVFANE